MKKKLLVLGVIIQTMAYGQSLSLPQVLNKLKANNYEIKSQEQQLEIDNLKVKQVFKTLLPGANLEVDTEILNNEKYKDMGEVFGPQTINAGYTVYAGGRIVNNYKKTKKDYIISEKQLETVQQNMEIKAIDLYFQILNLEKQIEITQLTKQSLLKQENRLNILFSNKKMVSKNELLEVKADIMSIDAEILGYLNDSRLAKEKLFVLIGVDVSSEYSLEQYNEEFMLKNIQQLEKDIGMAKNSGNVALKKQLEIEKAELDVKIAKAGFLPTIRLNGEYRLDEKIKTNDKNGDWGLGLEASMNVFQWGATLDNIESSKIALNRKVNEKNNSLENLSVEIRGKHSKIEQLKKELEISTERSELLRENSRIQNIRFTNGLLSSLNYLESVQLFRKAEEKKYAVQKSLILANREYNNLIK
ncbi:MAG: TolC family protein [Fusobacteriaceae bacterium]